MKKYLVLTLCLCLVFMCVVSCALWKEKATVTYEGTGGILTDVYNGVKPLCDSGQLSSDKCAVLKESYNKARTAYIVAGDALILTIDIEQTIANTTDAVKKKELQAKLQDLMNQYTKNLSEAVKLVSEFEILYNELGGK